MSDAWLEANQRVLMASVDVIRHRLARAEDGVPPEILAAVDAARESLPAPAAIDVLVRAFHLSPFERDVVLLCAGVELDSALATACAAATAQSQPTFSVALAVLPDAHWSALTPAAPLRAWHLVEVGSGSTLTNSPLRIDERILHFLTGIATLDERCRAAATSVASDAALPPSHERIAESTAERLLRFHGEEMPRIELCGTDPSGARAVAASIAARTGMQLFAIQIDDLPASPAERELLARLWTREALLAGAALLIETHRAGADIRKGAAAFADRIDSLVFVSTREPLAGGRRHAWRVDVSRPARNEQRELWRRFAADRGTELDGEVDRLVEQFDFGANAIDAATAYALAVPDGDRGETLWEACRLHARPRMEDLAQRIVSAATWEDLVLPAMQHEMLQMLVVHIRQRSTVYEEWGFGARGARGLGITALFAGPSGTGKTLAAEVLANALQLDLFRIDLSAVVSKYIGETEENLRRVFDAAEEGGAVLLFDEADALFGKRTEVRDSHDRYANLEVSYLLQRMEAYRGLAILTTNMRSALDPAFLRRLRFIIEFPFPDAAQRNAIWRRSFPRAVPLGTIDYSVLARLNIAGGHIRNIALGAAFLAAEDHESVGMKHLLRAARSEYTKVERSLTDAEVQGWTP
jgi:hypothetical protein